MTHSLLTRSWIALLLLASTTLTAQAPVAPSWLDFAEATQNGTQAFLPDFSYSGYRFSDEPIPDVSDWARFNVLDYGATPNDDTYDDAGIQAAIDAAEASSAPAVVFFPAGRFVVSSDNDIRKRITVQRSDIVLKGSGSNDGGTEIFMDKMRVRNGHFQFVFRPEDVMAPTVTQIRGSARRGDFTITVDNANRLAVGQTIIIKHRSLTLARAHFGDLMLSPRWTNMFTADGGMDIHEYHKIESISGNQLTFKNPIQTVMPVVSGGYNVKTVNPLVEVGVEDIRFVGNWPSVGEDFEHHKNDIHDYAWNALQFDYVENGWIRNCEFKDWSQGVDIRDCMALTLENVTISGKPAHASFITRRSYGLLIKDCADVTGFAPGGGTRSPTHHGPGVGFSGVSTVYLRFNMSPNQRIDAHSGSPYASLYDDMGGNMINSGGPERLYPNHGRHLVCWNFKHDAGGRDINYDFWSLERRRNNTFAEPIFVGFQPDARITFRGAGLNELNGQEVQPRSLFEAQLLLRQEGVVNSMDNAVAEHDLQLAPSPAHDFVRLTTSAVIEQVHVFNMAGQLVNSQAFSSPGLHTHTIDVADFPAGIYLIRTRTDRGLVSRKLIVR